MKTVEGVHVLTYEEWKKKPDVAEMLLKQEDCPVCDGNGQHQCECGHEHDCMFCDGSGKTTDFREMYERSLRDELKKYKSFVEFTA